MLESSGCTRAQRCTQDQTLLLQQLVVVAEKRADDGQAWWQEDLVCQERWCQENITQKKVWD